MDRPDPDSERQRAALRDLEGLRRERDLLHGLFARASGYFAAADAGRFRSDRTLGPAHRPHAGSIRLRRDFAFICISPMSADRSKSTTRLPIRCGSACRSALLARGQGAVARRYGDDCSRSLSPIAGDIPFAVRGRDHPRRGFSHSGCDRGDEARKRVRHPRACSRASDCRSAPRARRPRCRT